MTTKLAVDVSLTIRNIAARDYAEARVMAKDSIHFWLQNRLDISSMEAFCDKARVYKEADNTFTVVIP